MASEAEKIKKRIAEEKAKALPDSDILYTLKLRLPYANSIDTEKVKRGAEKLRNEKF